MKIELFKKKFTSLLEAYDIKNIEKLANSIGIYKSETKTKLTEEKKKFSFKVISEHLNELEKDITDYEFHLASIWKILSDL